MGQGYTSDQADAQHKKNFPEDLDLYLRVNKNLMPLLTDTSRHSILNASMACFQPWKHLKYYLYYVCMLIFRECPPIQESCNGNFRAKYAISPTICQLCSHCQGLSFFSAFYCFYFTLIGGDISCHLTHLTCHSI